MKKSILIYLGITFLASIVSSLLTRGYSGIPYFLGVMAVYCIVPAILPLLIFGISKLINKPVGKDILFYILYAIFFIFFIVSLLGS